jgi:hypothetical protein
MTVIAFPPLGYDPSLIGRFEPAAVRGVGSPGSNPVAVDIVPTG